MLKLKAAILEKLGYAVQLDLELETQAGKICPVTVNGSEFEKTVDNCAEVLTEAIKVRLPGRVPASCLNTWRKRDGFFSFVLDGIYPGTKWCGPGNIATGPSDLGILRDLDKCCRKHDSCTDSIPCCGASRHGLTNYSPFTRSSCSCDYTFYKCLKNVNIWHSQMIQFAFFQSGAEACFEYDYPYKCTRKTRHGFCTKWKKVRGKKGSKKWQWGKYTFEEEKKD